MTTIADAIDAHGIDVLDHLDRQATIPVLTGLQRQGDVIVIPARPGADPGDPIPAAGLPVVRGEAGGNTHALVGTCHWRPTSGGDPLELGTVTVPEGGVAYLAHPEHGYQGIGPGTYRIRRQREQADEIRMVAD